MGGRAKWNAYLQLLLFGGARVTRFQLSYAIIRPGILFGSRDHSRPAEEVGAWFLIAAGEFVSKAGLQNLADGTKPLDAPEMLILLCAYLRTP